MMLMRMMMLPLALSPTVPAVSHEVRLITRRDASSRGAGRARRLQHLRRARLKFILAVVVELIAIGAVVGALMTTSGFALAALFFIAFICGLGELD
jgi:hypothetical protein